MIIDLDVQPIAQEDWNSLSNLQAILAEAGMSFGECERRANPKVGPFTGSAKAKPPESGTPIVSLQAMQNWWSNSSFIQQEAIRRFDWQSWSNDIEIWQQACRQTGKV